MTGCVQGEVKKLSQTIVFVKPGLMRGSGIFPHRQLLRQYFLHIFYYPRPCIFKGRDEILVHGF